MTIPWLPLAAGLARGTEAYQAQEDRKARLQLAAAQQARQAEADARGERDAAARFDLDAYKAGLVPDTGQGPAIRDIGAATLGVGGVVDPELFPVPKGLTIGGRAMLPDVMRLAGTRDTAGRQNRFSSPFATADGYATLNLSTGEAAPVQVGGERARPRPTPQREPGKEVRQDPSGALVIVDKTTGQATPVRGAAGVRPPTELAKGREGVQTMIANLDAYEQALDRIGPRFNPMSTDAAELGTRYQTVLLALKEAQNLGVLNGPDLMLLQRQLADPVAGLGSLRGKDQLKAQLKAVRDFINTRARSLEATYTGGNATITPAGSLEAQYQAGKGRRP